MITHRRLATMFAAALFLAPSTPKAQAPIGAAALGDLVQGLGVNTRVLIIGAHPDDEDTYLISWLAKGKHVETAYLSLTRGEGGQNLIGNELGYALGQIRTEELLAARRIDGGHQYFTRAVDFGFSKSLAETSERWPRDLILKDVVAIIRTFRPHVIISAWMGTPADGHGHHQYAGVIAKEAFAVAADSTKYRDAGAPWAAAKFYRIARMAGGASTTPVASENPGNVKFNVGEYDPISGRSYAETAVLSRSQHRSQGQGRLMPIGTLWDGLTLDTSRVGLTRATDTALFAGIDTTWSRFAEPDARKRPDVDSMLAAIRTVQREMNLANPDAMVPMLSRIVELARSAGALNCHSVAMVDCNADKDYGLAMQTTLDRAAEALLLAAGVSLEAYADREKVAVRDSVGVTVALYNRGKQRVAFSGGQIRVDTASTLVSSDAIDVLPDSTLRLAGRVVAPGLTYPWWLVYGVDQTYSIYDLQDRPGQRRGHLPSDMLRGDDRIRWASADATVTIDGASVSVSAPVVYRFADPVRGEERQPMVGVPRITTVFQSAVEYIRANTPVDRGIRVEVSSAWSMPDTVNVQLGLPPGLHTDSLVRRVVLPPFGKTSVFFRLQGNVKQAEYKVVGRAVDRAGFYQQGIIDVLYDHINPVRYYQPPEVYLSAVDVKIPPSLQVAYLHGVGDNVQRMLEQLEVKVKSIAAEALPMLDPAAYSTLVIGPRAFESNDAALAATPFIQAFARRGGTVVTQYQQIADQPGILPYAVKLSRPADRVTDETAAVTFVSPGHRVVTLPNRITAEDFANWGQERGLYMPQAFDPQWKAIFEMHDAGEPPNYGGLLVAPVGKGTYVYTTLSFFRQLPGGNPGAARLFVNLLSAGVRLGPQP